jgi:hypothetical protein
MGNSTEFPWATAIIAVIAFIIVVVGGGVVMFGSSGSLTFDRYLTDLERLAVAVGILGIGRGIRSGLAKHNGQ